MTLNQYNLDGVSKIEEFQEPLLFPTTSQNILGSIGHLCILVVFPEILVCEDVELSIFPGQVHNLLMPESYLDVKLLNIDVS